MTAPCFMYQQRAWAAWGAAGWRLWATALSRPRHRAGRTVAMRAETRGGPGGRHGPAHTEPAFELTSVVVAIVSASGRRCHAGRALCRPGFELEYAGAEVRRRGSAVLLPPQVERRASHPA